MNMKEKMPQVEIDRVIHAPARLVISAILYAADQTDFLFLMNQTGLTKGNLSSHLSKLEDAGYIDVQKTYNGKIPQTLYRLTKRGRSAFNSYRENLGKIIDQ